MPHVSSFPTKTNPSNQRFHESLFISGPPDRATPHPPSPFSTPSGSTDTINPPVETNQILREIDLLLCLLSMVYVRNFLNLNTHILVSPWAPIRWQGDGRDGTRFGCSKFDSARREFRQAWEHCLNIGNLIGDFFVLKILGHTIVAKKRLFYIFSRFSVEKSTKGFDPD